MLTCRTSRSRLNVAAPIVMGDEPPKVRRLMQLLKKGQWQLWAHTTSEAGLVPVELRHGLYSNGLDRYG